MLEANGVIHFPDAFTDGFGWDAADGSLKYPYKPAKVQRRVCVCR